MSDSQLAKRVKSSYRWLYRIYNESPTRLRAKRLINHGRLAPTNLFVFDDRRLIYVETPKAACTSIKWAIGQAYQIRFKNAKDVHSYHDWNMVVGYEALAPHQRDYYKFSFVRNPFARLVSFYRNFVVRDGSIINPHKGVAVDTFLPIPVNSSFAQLVYIVASMPDFLADRHFKSQVDNLLYKQQSCVDFIGRMENLDADWKTIARKFSFAESLPRLNPSTKTNQSSIPYYRYYTPQLAKIVYWRYRQDFELLGYEDAYQTLLTQIDS